MREFESLDCTEDYVAGMAEKAVDAAKSREKEVKRLRKQLSAKQSVQSRASCQYKKKARGSNEQKTAYKALREARQSARVVRGVLIPEEAALRAAKAF